MTTEQLYRYMTTETLARIEQDLKTVVQNEEVHDERRKVFSALCQSMGLTEPDNDGKPLQY